MRFSNKGNAIRHFGEDIIEECPRCGNWSASKADHEDGDITGMETKYQEATGCERMCETCQNRIELCQFCNLKEPVIDDFGIIACQKCLDYRPWLKKKLNQLARAEKEQLGY